MTVPASVARRPGPTALALMAVGVAWLLLGPWALLAALLTLAVPRVRRAFSVRALVGLVAVGLLVLGLVVGTLLLAPAGSLPIPPGPGLLTAPAYVGAPATPQPVEVPAVPDHPFLSPHGTSSMHNDPYATDTYAGPGPVGRDMEVDTAWFGLRECATLAFDGVGRIVALCGDLRGPSLHVLDPDSLRVHASADLPDRPDSDTPPWKNLCGGAYFYLDQEDRAVVATTDRRILTFTTSDDAGRPTLTQVDETDLSDVIPDGDCLLALMPDWGGRTWFATTGGRVGYALPTGSRVVDLGEEIANSFAVDEDGGVYVVSDAALYRLEAGPEGPRLAWRTAYDRGSRLKPGQLSQGSGTTPTLLAGGRVAITDNAEPRMQVLVLDRATGDVACEVPVLPSGRSATDNSLVAVGDWLFVENNHGYAGPWSTMLGRTTSPGLVRVDADTCEVAWTSAEVAPTSVPKASAATGLLYVWATRRSRWGVTAWYLTAVDLRTGRTTFAQRAGTGPLFNNHYAAVTLGPDGSAYIATLAGLVRLRDG